MPPRLNVCSYLPRRLQIVASLAVFIVICIIFLGRSGTDDFDPYLEKVPYGPQLQDGVHHAVEGAQQIVDHIPNPLGAPAHKPPPEQSNSTSGEAKWFADWSWRNPFSSDTTLDEERAVLPPLPERPRIYTYYDVSTRRKDEQSKQAEQDLIQLWRRAWWAQGFRPIVLSKSEAMNNPLYRIVQQLKLETALDNELMRWLAWGNMGTGILSNWLALPMAAYDDPMLAFLRRGEYPTLTRYEGLGNGLFIGSKEDVDAALKEAVNSPALKRVKYIDEAFPPDTVQVDSKHDAIAYYGLEVLKAKYTLIKERLEAKAIGEALKLLPDLINSHLHLTWQNTFSKGITILKPLPEHTSALIEAAEDIALNLTSCPVTHIPSSCPPNRPKCKTCVSNTVKLSYSKVYRNESELFTIATVPHPYTMQSMIKSKDNMDLQYIRRETDRDVWIQAATKELLGTGVSSFSRLPKLKDAIASEYGSSRSLWLTAERPFSKDSEKDLEELDWIFGFKLPREEIIPSGKSETPVPGPERRPKLPSPEYGDGPIPSEAELQNERTLLEGTRRALTTKATKQVREITEAWNLADTEAWKFVRAYNARRRIERRGWEEEESDFQGKGVFDRWVDKII
ncbi:hypothetical protein CLAFUW4_00309 [Fulvia fulva]|uniref:Uncharacterized protein n=1 Tax=Passalora fulva TaxID=5499 RepID=A0A9Q8L7Q3_PASFU|nr:uncharacterized protein CLAFUR5_00309 [Fulvia fulva]KAK4634883.1 hypothetical protein CLAFUR4_00309 [Fulvia fulva]UJO12393.1 hypothetical protein CLAFUR5_00309 [Fulvia fulva]WPV10153.1 hypothetical protein CLAFUW4_00309 [Fulvia fulva]WPV24143.1 hypothetical protein CLAFUW7_00313 [Fulvia fulva]